MKGRNSLERSAPLGDFAPPVAGPYFLFLLTSSNGPAAGEVPVNASLNTLAIHAGYAKDPAAEAVTPPLHLMTEYARRTDLLAD
jgi:hypothetical protein